MMMFGDDRILGSWGYVTFRDERAFSPEVEIPITMWSIRSDKLFQDNTSSENYDKDSSLIHPTQVAVATRTEGMIQGRYRVSRVPPTLVNAIYSGEIVPMIVLAFSPVYEFGRGYFQLRNFEINSPVDGVVDFVAVILSEGVFNVNRQAFTQF